MVYTGATPVAVTGTAVQFSTTSQECTLIKIKAIKASGAANGAIVYIGGPTVTAATGYPLAVGAEATFDTNPTNAYNLMDFWVNGTTTDGVVWLYVRR